MSGSGKKRGTRAGEHRSTQSSVQNSNKQRITSESIEKDDILPMCSCGASGPSKEDVWKEDSVEGEEKKRVSGTKETDEIAKEAAATGLAIVPEKPAAIERARPSRADSEHRPEEKLQDSEGDKIQSPEKSLDESAEAEAAAAAAAENVDAASMQERMNSTSFSEENYRTPMLSPDSWPRQDADEIRQDLENTKLEESLGEEEAERGVDEDRYEDEKSSAADPVDWSGSPVRGGIFSRETEEMGGAAEVDEEEAAKEPMMVQLESAPNYDRLTADMLISVIESHRDALNDQKVVLARQTDAINRLASAVEKQTNKIISTLNENKLPVRD